MYCSCVLIVEFCLCVVSEITSLISDMHACADRIIDLFSIRIGETSDETLMENPDKLCTAVKQALREGSVGMANSSLLCSIF